MNQAQDDEIDLFELFQTLWDGKWLISVIVTFTTLIGFGYLQVAQPKYDVAASYKVNIYSVNHQQMCEGKIGCMESQVIKRFISLLEGEWRKKKRGKDLLLSTTMPSDLSEYKAQTERANAALTNEIYKEATSEIALIKRELTGAMLNTERVATNMLNALKVVQSIESGQSAVTFDSFSVVKSSPKFSVTLPLSVVLGGGIGATYVIILNAIRKRKQKLA